MTSTEPTQLLAELETPASVCRGMPRIASGLHRFPDHSLVLRIARVLPAHSQRAQVSIRFVLGWFIRRRCRKGKGDRRALVGKLQTPAVASAMINRTSHSNAESVLPRSYTMSTFAQQSACLYSDM